MKTSEVAKNRKFAVYWVMEIQGLEQKTLEFYE